MQLNNSIISISSSGIFGHGINNIPIYFPELQTDFIFASFTSCFGLLGSIILIMTIFIFDKEIINIAKNKKGGDVMPNISTGINLDSNFLNLKAIEIKEVRPEVEKLLVDGEKIMCAFKTIRDQVIFTNNRIFVVNVKGVTGKKIAYFSYPYSKIQYYGIETAGFMDIDSELILTFSNGHILQFDFKSNVDIRMINSLISKYVL